MLWLFVVPIAIVNNMTPPSYVGFVHNLLYISYANLMLLHTDNIFMSSPGHMVLLIIGKNWYCVLPDLIIGWGLKGSLQRHLNSSSKVSHQRSMNPMHIYSMSYFSDLTTGTVVFLLHAVFFMTVTSNVARCCNVY
ncbi:hypothetical protein GOP47_0016550 [Adiantum capillus-veneris]|uniref:Uncharacterized protein n=1 Tax=Adiantum capillus-veneris TaxID=13818 RepID=A0A9D4UI13_ADICA|nr:hypothetical protein GOP47_0016550 [Adiantum capillus-veneris]